MKAFAAGTVVVGALAAWAGCSGGNATNTTPTSPTPNTFSLSGTITSNSTRSGIQGATVSIVDGPNAGRSATTDGSGNYSLTALHLSGFTVSVSAAGYVSASQGVTLTSNQT